MKTKKLIAYNLLTYIAVLNLLYLFFGGEGLDRFVLNYSYMKNLILPFILITLLVLVNFFINYSYITASSLHKKNLLRISAIIIMIILIISIFARISELFNGKFILFSWISTLLYLIMLSLIISILKDLYKLISKLFKNS